MSHINPPTSAMQVDQSQGSGAISSLAAVVKELSKDPKNALSKPIGYWLPWLQEEGYTSEGFDHLLLSIVPQEHQTQGFDTIRSAYGEAKNSAYSTLKFLLSLKQRDPELFRHCYASLTTQLISFENVNSLAGGKLTGPAATFIKKHPVVSTELLACGLAGAWLLTELTLTHFAEKSLKASIEQNAIQNAVDKSESSTVTNLATRASESSVPIDVTISNAEAHPKDFVSTNFPNLDDLKGHMLTKENADRFVMLALKGEEGALLSDEEQALLREVRAVRLLEKKEGLTLDQLDNIIADRQEDFDSLERYLRTVDAEDAGWINDYISNAADRNLLSPNRLFKLRNQYQAIDLTLDRIQRNTIFINQVNSKKFASDYDLYVKNGTTEQLNRAFATLVGADVKTDPAFQEMYDNIELDFDDMKGNLDALIVEDEQIVLEDILDDTLEETNALAKEFLSSEYEDLVAMFEAMEKGAKTEVENFIDNKL